MSGPDLLLSGSFADAGFKVGDVIHVSSIPEYGKDAAGWLIPLGTNTGGRFRITKVRPTSLAVEPVEADAPR